jgi:hypothetical protein
LSWGKHNFIDKKQVERESKTELVDMT